MSCDAPSSISSAPGVRCSPMLPYDALLPACAAPGAAPSSKLVCQTTVIKTYSSHTAPTGEQVSLQFTFSLNLPNAKRTAAFGSVCMEHCQHARNMHSAKSGQKATLQLGSLRVEFLTSAACPATKPEIRDHKSTMFNTL
jgi:hypothetical protein